METAKTLPKLRMVDDQLNTLIPQSELPFFSRRSHWSVEAPDNFRDARQLGREMALAFLRVEPGNGDRQCQLDFLTRFILDAQFRALKQGGNAAEVIEGFWGTIARFAEPAATVLNVERWRGYTQERTKYEKQQDALWAATAKRERSERSRKAALAGVGKRRNTAKRGKAVRS